MLQFFRFTMQAALDNIDSQLFKPYPRINTEGPRGDKSSFKKWENISKSSKEYRFKNL